VFLEIIVWINLLLSKNFTDEPFGNQEGIIKDQRVWSLSECAEVMAASVKTLYKQFKVILLIIKGCQSFDLNFLFFYQIDLYKLFVQLNPLLLGFKRGRKFSCLG
jgi:hypothetical protein